MPFKKWMIYRMVQKTKGDLDMGYGACGGRPAGSMIVFLR